MANWYDRAGKPIDVTTANDLLGDPKYKRVALTWVTSASDPSIEYRVSTVWLGLDHNWGGGEPILFETMSFGGGEDQDGSQWRWVTEEAARAGHAEIVSTIAATVTDEQVEELDEWPQA